MLPNTPHHTRRVHFYATVLAVEVESGVTRRAAFRRVNDHHPTLSGTFVSVEAFEVWMQRNRINLYKVTADSGEIPTVWDDVTPIGREGDELFELQITENTSGFTANAAADTDRRRFVRDMIREYDKRALTDADFRQECVRCWVEVMFPRDTC